jgi:Mrp family chromosome partitioning ATPase
MVVLDAPPVGLTTDAKLLTEMVDGTLLVIRAGQSQFQPVSKAIEVLGGQEALLGVVLNGTDSDPEPAYYRYSAEAEAGKRG